MSENSRIDRLRSYMADNGLAAALLLKPANQHYITKFKAIIYSRPIAVFVTADKTAMIVPGLEERHAGEEAGVDELIVYYEHPEKADRGVSAWDALAGLVKGLGSKPVIGVEESFCPVALVRMLRDWGAEPAELDRLIIGLRLVKDDEELDLLRRAGELVNLAVTTTLSELKPGRSELEVESLGDVAMLRRASERFPGQVVEGLAMTTSGIERTVLPHALSSARCFDQREMLIHSRQIGLQGYRSECERTVFIGRPTDRQAEVFQAAYEAQQAAIAAIKAGATCKSIDQAARGVIQAAGLGEYAVHRTGHGLGLEAHEAPYLRFDDESPLQAGMVVSIEPGIYVPGVGGFRHSDTVIVTETGGEVITQAPAALDEVIF